MGLLSPRYSFVLNPGVEHPEYVVLGTLDRHTWRRGLEGDVQLTEIRASMADFKKYLRVEVIPDHRVPRHDTAS